MNRNKEEKIMLDDLKKKVEGGVFKKMGISQSGEMTTLGDAAKPLLKLLCDNYHPHVTVIVTPDSVELLSSGMRIINSEFIKD